MKLILGLTLWMLCGPGTELLVDVGDPIEGRLVYAHVVVTAECPREWYYRTCRVVHFVLGESNKLRYPIMPHDLRRGWKSIIRLVPPNCDRRL